MADEKKVPFHNPFGGLERLKGSLPEGPKVPAVPPKEPKGPARAVVRMERVGRGGKEVTVIEQLDLSLVQRQHWLKDLKGALGCGGTLEGDDLVLQGDHRERAAKWLEGRGVKKVSIG